MKKATASLVELGAVVKLLPTSNREVGATSVGVGPKKKYEVEYEFAKDRQSEEMIVMMKVLIEKSTKINNK